MARDPSMATALRNHAVNPIQLAILSGETPLRWGVCRYLIRKFQEALDKVGEKFTNPKAPKSPTFGELIEKGELSGGKQ